MFGKRKIVEPVTEHVPGRVDWPDGTFLDAGNGIYFIKAGKRYKLYSYRTMISWGTNPIMCLEENISHLKAGGTLGFRDSTLIKDVSDGRIYLIASSKRRHIVNPDWLKVLRKTPMEVSHDEVLLHGEGEELNGLDSTKVAGKR